MAVSRPRKGSSAALIRDAAADFAPGSVIEFASEVRCYVTAPIGKAWAVDHECHVLMIVRILPDDLARGIDWIKAGLVDCPAPDCEFCAEMVAAESARNLRIGLDSACL